MRGVDPYVPRHGDARYRVHRYELELDYRPSTNALSGRARLQVEALEALTDLDLDLIGLGVDKVAVDGRPSRRYRHRDDRLTVVLVEPAPAGSRLVVDVRWSGRPQPLDGRWGEVGWEELSDGVIVAGQPDGAPTWFPCNDHPSDKASYRIAVTTESGYHVVANGVLLERRSGGSRTTWVYEQAEPMASYLATVQIGRYEAWELAATPVPQTMVVPPELADQAGHDLSRSPRMLEVFSALFGPYPFAGYTVVVTDDELEIPLEAQGISVFGANHVDGARGSERLVAHELAHQWFGNSLTVARWQDLWLNEGFACYAEWLWSEHCGGDSAHEHATAAWTRLSQLDQDLLLADPGPDLMFDDRLYKRGALTLHALRLRLGDGSFFALLRRWVAEHRHATVSTQQFAALCGPDVADLLEDWLRRTPLPPLQSGASSASPSPM